MHFRLPPAYSSMEFSADSAVNNSLGRACKMLTGFLNDDLGSVTVLALLGEGGKERNIHISAVPSLTQEIRALLSSHL